MTDFLDIDLTIDAPTILQTALARLSANLASIGITGYTPNAANLEVILLTVASNMAADLLSQASQVPAAIFRQFGVQLFQLPYETGAAATAASTWTLTDTLGHTIPGGTQVTINGYAFNTVSDVVVASGSSTATVQLVAVDTGSVYNNQLTPVALVDPLDWVASITLVAPTANGQDQQTDSAYQETLSSLLQLQAPRPITAADFAAMVLNIPSGVVPSGTEIGRATAIDGYNPQAASCTASSTATSTTLSSVSSFTDVAVGTVLTGPGIPAGTTVVSVNTGAGTLVMSAAATATASGITVQAGVTGQSRCVTVWVTDMNGAALGSTDMAAIATWLESYREANFLVFVLAPTFTDVYVTYEVHVLPAYDTTAVLASVDAALEAFLSAFLWGNPNGQENAAGQSEWLNSGYNMIRYNQILGIIANVPGVQYVPDGSAGLAIGLAATPTGTTDLTLPGPAPLPLTTSATITGTAV